MAWINARWVIASMKNMEIIWNWTIGQYPCDAMSANISLVQRHISIPLLAECTRPYPAGIGLFNFLPKPPSRLCCRKGMLARPRAILCWFTRTHSNNLSAAMLAWIWSPSESPWPSRTWDALVAAVGIKAVFAAELLPTGRTIFEDHI